MDESKREIQVHLQAHAQLGCVVPLQNAVEGYRPLSNCSVYTQRTLIISFLHESLNEISNLNEISKFQNQNVNCEIQCMYYSLVFERLFLLPVHNLSQ